MISNVHKRKKINSEKIRIVFIDPVSICKKYPMPAVNPLGLCYLSAISKNQGYVVKIFQKLDTPKNQFKEKILKFKPDICAFSVFTSNLKFCLKLAKLLKNKLSCKIIFGGPHPTGDPHIVKNKFVDFAVIGEGENTFSELVDFITNKKNNLGQINGISYVKSDKVIINPSRQRIKDLDKLPLPDLSGLPIHKYKRILSITPLKQQKFIAILSSRGCPYSCKFCVSPLIWKQQLYFRNPKKVIDEIEFLVKKHKINTFRFLDNDFMINRKHALSVCNELIKRKIKVSWGCFGSLRSVSLSLLEKMKKAGCVDIFYGIESVSQKTLDEINKKLFIKDILSGLKKTDTAGLINVGAIIIGYPHETETDLIDLEKLLKKLPIDRLEISFLTPYPGTCLFKSIKPNQYITKNTDYFDSQTPIIKTKIPLRSMLAWRNRLYRGFYCSETYKNRVLKKIKKYPEFLVFYKNLFSWLYTQSYLRGYKSLKNLKTSL